MDMGVTARLAKKYTNTHFIKPQHIVFMLQFLFGFHKPDVLNHISLEVWVDWFCFLQAEPG